MRYTITIKYNNKEISFKGTKALEGKWELKDFLKKVREISGITDSTLQLKTDISPKRMKLLESGDIEFTPDDIKVLQSVYKLPKKMLKILDDDKPLWTKRIIEMRSQYHYTQKQVSEFLGIAQTTYAGYETGRNEPDIKTMIKLSDLYKVDLNYLMGRYK